MNDKWTIMRYSTARSLEELPNTALNELKEAIKKEEDHRNSERARELREQVIKLMRQIENEGFLIMYEGDKFNPSDIEVQY